MGFFAFAFCMRYGGQAPAGCSVARFKAMVRQFNNGMTHADSAFCMPNDEISDYHQCLYIRRMNSAR